MAAAARLTISSILAGDPGLYELVQSKRDTQSPRNSTVPGVEVAVGVGVGDGVMDGVGVGSALVIAGKNM